MDAGRSRKTKAGAEEVSSRRAHSRSWLSVLHPQASPLPSLRTPKSAVEGHTARIMSSWPACWCGRQPHCTVHPFRMQGLWSKEMLNTESKRSVGEGAVERGGCRWSTEEVGQGSSLIYIHHMFVAGQGSPPIWHPLFNKNSSKSQCSIYFIENTHYPCCWQLKRATEITGVSQVDITGNCGQETQRPSARQVCQQAVLPMEGASVSLKIRKICPASPPLYPSVTLQDWLRMI